MSEKKRKITPSFSKAKYQPNQKTRKSISEDREFYQLSGDLGSTLDCKVHLCRRKYYVGGGPHCPVHHREFKQGKRDSKGVSTKHNIKLKICAIPNCDSFCTVDSDFCAMHESRDLRFVDINDFKVFIKAGKHGG